MEKDLSLMVYDNLGQNLVPGNLLSNRHYSGIKPVKTSNSELLPRDKSMSDNDDISFLGFVREYYPDIVWVFLSGQGSLRETIESFNYPDAFRYITRIWNSRELNGKIAMMFGPYRLSMDDYTLKVMPQDQVEELSRIDANLKSLIKEPNHQLQEFVQDGIIMLAAIAEAREDNSGGHVFRIRQLTREICKRLGLSSSEIEDISFSSMMHDIGKIQISDDILLKPEALTGDELKIMETHCATGEEMLGCKTAFKTAREIARSHHERWDGTGYPDGLKGLLIPLAARITAVADSFDALTHERCYKKTWPSRIALYEMKALSGRQFDPEVLEAFIDIESSLMKSGRLVDSLS